MWFVFDTRKQLVQWYLTEGEAKRLAESVAGYYKSECDLTIAEGDQVDARREQYRKAYLKPQDDPYGYETSGR